MEWEYYNLCRFPWFPYWDTQLNSEKTEAPKIRTIFGCKRGIDMRDLLFQGYMEQNIYHFQASNLDRCKALENHLETSHFLTHCPLQKAVIVIFVTNKLPNKSEKICESRWNISENKSTQIHPVFFKSTKLRQKSRERKWHESVSH